MLEELHFTREDITRSKWREIISNNKKSTCNIYGRVFFEKAKDARENGDTALSEVFLLLHAVCDFWLRPEEKYTPFAPTWQGVNGSRSVDISDFSESHINLMKEMFEIIDEPEIRSRIGDVIWTYQHRGNSHFAEAAIDAYIQAAELFWLTDEYYYGVERITRAIHLAASLGINSKKFSEVVLKIEELIEQHSPAFRPFSRDLLELLYEYRKGNPDKNALLAENFARNHLQHGDWHSAREDWNAAARWHRLGNHLEAEQGCLLKEAECFVIASEDSLQHSTGMKHSLAARHMQSAIEALRRIPGTEVRRAELHSRMLELQTNSRDELGRISLDVDLTQMVEQAIRSVLGKSFQDAIFILCSIGSSPEVEILREQVDNLATENPLYSLISMNIINEKGRIIGKRDSMVFGTQNDIAVAKKAEMHRWAQIEQQMVSTAVNAVRLKMLQEHTPCIRNFLEITLSNPFVPPQRELIFAQGLLAGLRGDFLEALSLLVPQVENSIRYVLNQRRVVTSSLTSDGIQEEFDLNLLLEMQELNEIFGEDLVFDLKCNLTSRFGANFRNLLAHGLLDYQEFSSYTAVYIWWLLLRICCLPLINAQDLEEKQDATTPIE